MKVGLTITTHRSRDIRPSGRQLLFNFFKSLKESKPSFDYEVYVSDNSSTISFDYPHDDHHININYIDDQTEKGLTGAWNDAIYRAYEDGCDIIWNFNDDIELNSSINDFIKFIESWDEKHKTLFGPTSDNGGSPSPNTYRQKESGYKELQLTPNSWSNLPNGFSFAFTREFYERFRYIKNEFFPIDHPLNGGDGKWGGQEGYFGICVEDGMKAVIVKDCWLKHHKLRDWEVARDAK